MCGITGIYAIEGTASGKDIFRVTRTIRHRGPDDEGYAMYIPAERRLLLYDGEDSNLKIHDHVLKLGETKDVFLFGHRRLSIVDTSYSGHQPMLYDDGNLLTVYNGEIYNHLEIKNELIAKGYTFNSRSDTEVLLASYREWGTDCLTRLNGMWSFVLLDVKKNILFGSRDRFGVKPFYYFYSKGLFAFASEIKGLLAISAIKKKINEPAAFDYLMWGITEHSDETFFSGIRKLPKAHCFILDLNTRELNVQKYYELKYNGTLGNFDSDSYGFHVRNIQELLFNAIRARLRADVRVGSCLSGGIDSSSLVVIINDLLNNGNSQGTTKHLKAFSACYDDITIDETTYIKSVVGKCEIDSFQTYPSSNGFFKDLESVVYVQDEPFSTTSIYAQYMVMGLAKENGFKVLMDGQGGDELFSGYKAHYAAYFLELIEHFRFREMINEMLSLGNAPTKLGELSLMIAKHVGAKYAPTNIISHIKTILNSGTTYIDSDFRNQYGTNNSSGKDISCFSLNEMNYKLMAKRGLEALLKYEDRNSMAHSIETRVPFADDTELIEYVFSIPSIYKIRNGWSKALLRDAVGDLLPEKIHWRKDKLGFAVPQRKWLHDLKRQLLEIVGTSDSYIRTHLICKNFDNLINSGQSDVLWRYINFVLWRRVFSI